MRPRVYVETTIPSFYFEVRPEPEMVARRKWTREWWESAEGRYELVTSLPVLEELRRDRFPGQDDSLKMMSALTLLRSDHEAIEEIVGVYISHHLMPNDPVGDALHLALASYYKCDFLGLERRHLANANKIGHIRRVNQLLNLFVPSLVTPLELLEDEDQSA
jgi:hypothetical protein